MRGILISSFPDDAYWPIWECDVFTEYPGEDFAARWRPSLLSTAGGYGAWDQIDPPRPYVNHDVARLYDQPADVLRAAGLERTRHAVIPRGTTLFLGCRPLPGGGWDLHDLPAEITVARVEQLLGVEHIAEGEFDHLAEIPDLAA